MTAPSPLKLPDLHGLTVLVVDDNEDAVEVMAMFLEACGAHVLTARTAMGGLTYVDVAPKLDLLITDLSMPMMDGVEFVRTIRRHSVSWRRSVPVIALTGFPEEYVAKESVFNAFLRKPVDLDRLTGTIQSLVRRAD
jgi:CheY-like chemotaxis protein